MRGWERMEMRKEENERISQGHEGTCRDNGYVRSFYVIIFIYYFYFYDGYVHYLDWDDGLTEV